MKMIAGIFYVRIDKEGYFFTHEDEWTREEFGRLCCLLAQADSGSSAEFLDKLRRQGFKKIILEADLNGYFVHPSEMSYVH